MLFAPTPADETERLAVVRSFDILDTPSEAEFDDLAELASLICGTPVALMSMLDERRQWFKSRVGMAATETARDISFCGHAIAQEALFEVPDAWLDHRFADNPLASGPTPVRFYAGAPLIAQGGHRLGTLCVIDHVPRQLDETQKQALTALARVVVRQMENRAMARELAVKSRFRDAVIDSTDVAIVAVGIDGIITGFNRGAEQLLGYAADDVVGKQTPLLFHDADEIRARGQTLSKEAGVVIEPGVGTLLHLAGREQRVAEEWTFIDRAGVRVPVQITLSPIRDTSGALIGSLAIALEIAAAKRAQAEMLAVSDASPLGMFRTDPERRVTYVNRTYENITGLTAAQAQGDGWVAALHPEDREHILASRVAAAADRTGYINTQRFVRPDGVIAVCRVMASPIMIDGAFNGFVGTVEDITERRRVNDALSQSEQSLRMITNSIPALVSHVDARQRYLFVNAQAAQAASKKPEAMIGRSLQQEHSRTMYALLKPYIERALRGETVTFEGSDPALGVERHFRTTYVPERNPTGDVIGFYAMTFDITETKQNELAQVAAERRLRTITDNLPVLITYVDQERYLRFANATLADWIGVTPEEAVDRPFQDVVGADIYAHRVSFIDRALAGERVEFEIESRIGNVGRHLQAVYLPDRAADGTVQGFYTLSFDISKLKASEQSLLHLARIDSLTGLANRYQLNEKLDEAVARHQRSGLAMAVMYLDIDRFKQINDSAGHAAGDLVLIEFAARLQGAIRNTDTVARLSGDEFVVILEGLHVEEEATAVAAKILAAMQPVFACEGLERSVSASIGIAYASAWPDPDTSSAPQESASTLLARADKALYAAKAGGRKNFAMA